MNSFGKKFRVSLFGESHGKVTGAVVDGVRPGIPLCEEDFGYDMRRRAPHKPGTTSRHEDDRIQILSGIYNGHTSGAPVCLAIGNSNVRDEDYRQFEALPRPGHADMSARAKYHGFNDPRGGGMFSGRMTAAIVAAGVIAKKSLRDAGMDADIASDIYALGGIRRDETDAECKWEELISKVSAEGDSLGGIVECRINGIPAGLGEPFWDSIESLIAHAVFSIPGVRGIEFGDGFKAAAMLGSEHNDPIGIDGKPLRNGAGGINGGISNGSEIVFRVAFKPASSISKPQNTLNLESMEMDTLEIHGRHDACFVRRCPVIVEAVSAIVLADFVEN